MKVAGIGVNHSPTWHYRHADDFDIVVYRTSLLKSTIRILWNSLDAKLKSSKSIVVLNVNIKKYCWFNSLFFFYVMYDMHVYRGRFVGFGYCLSMIDTLLRSSVYKFLTSLRTLLICMIFF